MLVLIKILHWILFLIIYRYLHAITTIVITIISIIIIIVQIYWPGGGLSLPPPTTFLNVRTIIVNTIISIIIITINTIVGCFWRGGGLSFPGWCRWSGQQHCVEPTIAAVSTSTKESTAPNCFVQWMGTVYIFYNRYSTWLETRLIASI